VDRDELVLEALLDGEAAEPGLHEHEQPGCDRATYEQLVGSEVAEGAPGHQDDQQRHDGHDRATSVHRARHR